MNLLSTPHIPRTLVMTLTILMSQPAFASSVYDCFVQGADPVGLGQKLHVIQDGYPEGNGFVVKQNHKMMLYYDRGHYRKLQTGPGYDLNDYLDLPPELRGRSCFVEFAGFWVEDSHNEQQGSFKVRCPATSHFGLVDRTVETHYSCVRTRPATASDYVPTPRTY